MKTIRWGIVGPGCIAHKFAKAVQNVECAELVAVASRTEDKGKEFAALYNIPQVFCGYEKMAEYGNVDAVYIATPHPFHQPCAELFMRAKKHVLCEKPLCINAAQAASLQACARENGVFLMEAVWTRFLPCVQDICKRVQAGEIGEVYGLEADFCYDSTPEEEAKLFQNDMAGGSLLDVGVYGLHFASLFFGSKPEQISAISRIHDGVDLQTDVLLQYAGGAIASLSSAIALQKPDSAYIYGTKGYIYVPHFYGATEFYIVKNGKETHIEKNCLADGFEEEIYEACHCMQKGLYESNILPVEESIAVLKIADVVRNQIGIKYPFTGEEF